MYRSLLSRDIFSELNRLQRFASLAFDVSPSVYGAAAQRFPAINVSTSPQAVEVSCFAPGISPDKLEVKLEKGMLSIAGERNDQIAADSSAESHEDSNLRVNERFLGRFSRVVSLPEDVGGDAVTAQYRDGVLLIKVPRREAAQPRRITIQ